MPLWTQGVSVSTNFSSSPASNSSNRFYDAVEVLSPSFKDDVPRPSFQGVSGESEKGRENHDQNSDSRSHIENEVTSPSSEKSHPAKKPSFNSKEKEKEKDEDFDEHLENDLGEALDDLTRNNAEPQLKLANEGMDEVEDLSAQKKPKVPPQSILMSDFIYPKSRYIGHEPPLPPSKERLAVQGLLQEIELRKAEDTKLGREESPESSHLEGSDYVEIELSNFSVYLPEGAHNYSFELRPLQHLWAKMGVSSFLFDGILSVGKAQYYVQAVPFQICSIGNYGEELHTVGGNIWLQSYYNSDTNVYYKLKSPASEYHRFHEGFLWLADFAKHFVDYSQARGRNGVSVFDFRSDFSTWIKKKHSESREFQNWFKQYGKDDFRQVVAVHILFLFKESVGVDEGLRDQPIFAELMAMNAIPKQEIVEQNTIVTPFVYDCFKDMNFGAFLKPIEPKIKILPSIAPTKDSGSKSNTPPRKIVIEVPTKRAVVRVGDVIAVATDGEDSEWKDEVSKYKEPDRCWYLYVQSIHEPRYEDEERSFDALWLYKPSDTSCAKMRYPFLNELFLSDNCTCSRGRISQSEVLEIVTVLWNCNPPPSNDRLFVRQTWLENERFVTFQESHKRCEHLRPTSTIPLVSVRFPIGQTVLCRPPQGDGKTLEVYEVVKHFVSKGRSYTLFRRLLRRHQIDGRGRPNELTYTNQVDKISSHRIDRKCNVRFYSEADVAVNAIPVPYCRDGVGSCFYITTRLVKSEMGDVLEPIDTNIPRGLIQGYDPLALPSREPMRGLDLYCGGGNFGRGIEEGGAVHNEVAVDCYNAAIHTYNANQKTPGSTKLFYGSVNDLLLQAMEGNPKNSELIPRRDKVDFISAGSPCQGFSGLNQHKNNEKGLRNQSLVASVAAYIDFYRPKYGILENVITMAQKGTRRDEDPLSQLICAIVGMGYQLEIFMLDAWSHGSPQSRSRLFVCFTAPGFTPLDEPDLTHSHPDNVQERGLGKLANGQNFGQRRDGPTPFRYVTAGEATQGLPVIGDAHTYQCTSFPYHVALAGMSELLKSQIDAIPTHPWGMNFAKSWNEGHGVMTLEERSLFPGLTKSGKLSQCVTKRARSWGRVNPLGLFPTIVVKIRARDACMGTCLHWDQQRYLTIAEAQRAQSYPDGEVLVGSVVDQSKILGNSVARTVSMALGLKLREAWLANPIETDTTQDFIINEVQHKMPRKSKERLGNSISHIDKTVIIISDSDDDDDVDAGTTNMSTYQASSGQNLIASKPTDRLPRVSEALKHALHRSNTETSKSSTSQAHSGLREVDQTGKPKSSKRTYGMLLQEHSLVFRSASPEEVTHLDGKLSSYMMKPIKSLNKGYQASPYFQSPVENRALDSRGCGPLQGQTIFVEGGVDFDTDEDTDDSGFELAPNSDLDSDELEEVSRPAIPNTPGNNPQRRNVRNLPGSTDELAKATVLSQSSARERIFISRTTRTPDRVRKDAASSSRRKYKNKFQVLINLVTDDEEERPSSSKSQISAAVPPPKPKYIPVDNTQFDAYSQTHYSMNSASSSKRRKT
ncbi:hypothetical protein BGZ60DRAFT_530574 [Tricladium varicosporioides]|nr:hypothetical protein BGZ60DRAFT_530574 [Hymenoscyphus varicosporioides]